MKILIVGAGSVGQVYAYALQKAGADVALFVREKYQESLQKGFVLYPLNEGKQPAPVTVKIPKIITQTAEVAAVTWDAVVFCIAADAIHDPSISALLKATAQALIVSMIPGDNPVAEFERYVPRERIRTGVIGIISYPTPMPGEQRPVPGTAFWNAPLAASNISGTDAVTKRLVDVFNKGGLPFKLHSPKESKDYRQVVPRLMIAGLKHAHWQFNEFFKPENKAVFKGAVAESSAILKARDGAPLSPLLQWLLMPLAKVIIFVVQSLAPFDLEVYLRVHFMKVDGQMQDSVDELVDAARSYSLPAIFLRRLQHRG